MGFLAGCEPAERLRGKRRDRAVESWGRLNILGGSSCRVTVSGAQMEPRNTRKGGKGEPTPFSPLACLAVDCSEGCCAGAR